MLYTFSHGREPCAKLLLSTLHRILVHYGERHQLFQNSAEALRVEGRKETIGREARYSSPAFFHNSSTRCFTSADMRITPGQRRVKPSPGHLRVASMPIFEPKLGRRLE